MKRSIFFVPFLFVVTVNIFGGGIVLGQVGEGLVKVKPTAKVVDIGVEGVHGLVVLDREHVLITVSVREDGGGDGRGDGRGDGGVVRDRVLKVAILRGDDGGYSVETSRFGNISYKGVGGVAVSTDEKMVLVCDTVASRIYELDAGMGKLRGAIETAGRVVDVVAVGDGTLWYLTSDGRLHHFFKSRRTKVILDREAGRPVAIEGARGLAVLTATGEVVVGRGKSVVAIDPESGKVREFANGFSRVSDVCGVMIDDEEFLFVTDDEAGMVYILKMDGGKRVILESEKKDTMKPVYARSFGQQRYVAIVSTEGDHGEDDQNGHDRFLMVISHFEK